MSGTTRQKQTICQDGPSPFWIFWLAMNGILNITKPSGWTSHDVVQKVRNIMGGKKVGHTGTLDPLATGVLVLCVGKATRIARYLEAGVKEYRAEMQLGVTTDTLDADGTIVETRQYRAPERKTIEGVLRSFTGERLQYPPVYSALKVSGVPSYRLARQGRAQPLKARPVTVYRIDFSGFTDPVLRFTVRCAKGLYVRSLCADIGERLGMGAHLTSLVRTCSGRFRLEQAITLEALAHRAAEKRLESALIPIDEALADFPVVAIGALEAGRVKNGNQVPTPLPSFPGEGGPLRVHDQTGRLLALARAREGMLKPELVF